MKGESKKNVINCRNYVNGVSINWLRDRLKSDEISHWVARSPIKPTRSGIISFEMTAEVNWVYSITNLPPTVKIYLHSNKPTDISAFHQFPYS